jgi:hypothetical protein
LEITTSALPELDLAQLEHLGGVPGLLQHLGGHVDADHPALRSDLGGGDEAVEASAGADVDHPLAVSELA